ncbi:fatty acid-binding protein, liver-like [Branchiostoma lanceolatum]|uniref:fatty acid-binding protein, liver-like n=1 Tax=Branchiostoma lanceolatum TaxID=7740 RepID=UPI0034567227
MPFDLAEFNGNWRLKRHENYRQFLRKIGIPEENVEGALDVTTAAEVTQEGDVITWTGTTGGQKAVSSFQLGEEFDEEHLGGKKKVIYRWEEDSLVSSYQDWDGKGLKVTISRRLQGDTLHLTMTAGDVTCHVQSVRC